MSRTTWRVPVKPPVGAAGVDWSHPLAQGLTAGWLFNEGAGPLLDLVTPAPTLFATAGATLPLWQTTLRGPGVFWTDGAGARIEANIAAEPAAGPISVFGFVYPTATGDKQIMGRNSNGGWRYRYQGDQTIQVLDRGGTNVLGSTGTAPLNTWSSVGVVMDSSGLKIYINGILQGSNATAFGGGNGATELQIGATGDDGETWAGYIDTHWKYGRSLSASDIEQLHKNIYTFLRPVIRRRYFVFGAAVTRVPGGLLRLGVG